MDSKVLYQPVKLTFDMLENIKYPFDIWQNVFRYLEVRDYKGFFKTCWAFRSFGTWDLINKVAHKADSLFIMCKKEPPFSLWEYMSMGLLASNLKGMSGFKRFVESYDSFKPRECIPFSTLKSFYQDEIEEFASRKNSLIKIVIETFKMTFEDIVYLAKLGKKPELLRSYSRKWAYNPFIEWDEMMGLVELGYEPNIDYFSGTNMPFNELIKRGNDRGNWQDITCNPLITLRYMMDNRDLTWEWDSVFTKAGWSDEVVTEFLNLGDFSNTDSKIYHGIVCQRLRDICFNGKSFMNNPKGYPYLDYRLPRLHPDLCKYIPKGYIKSYLKARLLNGMAYGYSSSEYELIARKPFTKDEIEELVIYLLEYPDPMLDYFLPPLIVNPSFDPEALTELKGYSLEAYSEIKDKIHLLMKNPSFGFLDLAQELDLIEKPVS